MINDTNLLNVQDDDRFIGPDILYYYKKMLIYLLTNLSI